MFPVFGTRLQLFHEWPAEGAAQASFTDAASLRGWVWAGQGARRGRGLRGAGGAAGWGCCRAGGGTQVSTPPDPAPNRPQTRSGPRPGVGDPYHTPKRFVSPSGHTLGLWVQSLIG